MNKKRIILLLISAALELSVIANAFYFYGYVEGVMIIFFLFARNILNELTANKRK